MKNYILILLLFCSFNIKAQNESPIRFYQNYKAGFKDKNGKIIVPALFESASEFKNGFAIVSVNNKKGFIDQNGKIVIEIQFDDVSLFENGLSAAKFNGKYGYINTKGSWEIEPKFEEAYLFSNNRARVKLNSLYGYINNQGEEFIPCQYKVASEFNNNIAVVCNSNSQYFYIDVLNKPVFNKYFDFALPFFNYDTAKVKIKNENFIINKKGEIVEKFITQGEKEINERKEHKNQENEK
jgi:hypothetical protein